MMTKAFWLNDEPVNEAKLQTNKARKGDSDYGIKAITRGEIKTRNDARAARKKAERESGVDGDFESKHPRGGTGTSQGGKFIAKGDSGSAVSNVQDKLGTKVTGHYDANTAASVIQFQKRHGLVADGVVGRQTALALRGRYESARRAGPGALGPKTSKLVGVKYQPPRARRSQKAKKKKTSDRDDPWHRTRRSFGGGTLVEGLSEAFIVDALGNIHDALGKFASKGGGKTATAAHAIPTYDGSPLTITKSAGGSNGAKFAKHRDGSTWLVKGYGGNRDRIATELLANAVYRQLGAKVPRAGRTKIGSRDALAYPLVDGKPRPYAFQRKGAKPSPEVGQHFMADALLANWDVAGLEDDNILWTKGGDPFRVDQGGTLEYRAMGGKKDFGPIPMEIASMMAPGSQGLRSSAVTSQKMRTQAAQIAATLTPKRIDALIDSAGFSDVRMRERVRRNLKARIDYMRRYALGEVGDPVKLREAGDRSAARAAEWQSLAEAALGTVKKALNWKESAHPRDSHGKFIQGLSKLKPGEQIQVDDKTRVKRDNDGTLRVVRQNSIFKGYSNDADAARDALDKSARSDSSESIGGPVKFKGYNDYLNSRGVDPGEKTQFGGKTVTAADLQAEQARLDGEIKTVQASSDKYEKRTLKTLQARRAEVAQKLSGAETPKKPATPAPASGQSMPTVPTIEAAVSKLTTSSGMVDFGVGTKHKVGKKDTGSFAVQINGKMQDYPTVKGAAEALHAGKHTDAKKKPASMISHPGDDLGSMTTTLKIAKVGEVVEFGEKVRVFKEADGFTLAQPDGKVSKQSTPATAAATAFAIVAKAGKADGTDTSGGSASKSTPAALAPKASSKTIKGPQPITALGVNTQYAYKIDLAPGDVVQSKKGGVKWTVQEVGENGAVKFQSAAGQTKHTKYQPVGLVTKKDGSAIKLKDGQGPTQVSAGPAAKVTSVQSILGQLKSPVASDPTLGKLPNGAVIKTLDGKAAVMRPTESAYTGYTKAYLLDGSGASVEVPSEKKPAAFSTDPELMKAASATLAKANTAKASDKVKVAEGGGLDTVKGPPPVFKGAVSGSAATSYFTQLAKKGKATKEQKERVSSYVGSSKMFNDGLRDPKTKKDAKLLVKARVMDEAIDNQAPTDTPIHLIRKTTNNEWVDADVGEAIEDRGFFSTSTEGGISTGGVSSDGQAPIEVHVLVPPGRKAIWVNANGGGIHSEKEVVLPRNGGYAVLKSEKKNGTTVLYVEML